MPTVRQLLISMTADVGGFKISMKESAKSADELTAAMGKLDAKAKEVGNTISSAGLNFANLKAAGQTVKFAVRDVNEEMQNASRAGNNLGNSMKVVSGIFVNFGKSIYSVASQQVLIFSRLFAGVRQMGQAFLNLGITMSLFVGIPLQRALGGILTLTIELDKQLNAVRKTTGMTAEAIESQLKPALRSMALSVPASVSDLANLSQIIGQLGFTAVQDILGLTRVGVEMGNATDLSADKAVEAIGRITFAWEDLRKSLGLTVEEFSRKIGDMFVRLGNKFVITESQIAGAMSEAIATAKLLGVLPTELAGLITGLVNAGLGYEEAGTVVRRAFENMLQNADVIAEAAGMTEAAVKKLIATNPTGFLLDLLDAINKAPDGAQKLTAALGILEVRGLRAATASVDQMRLAVNESNIGFSNGNDLAIEYARSMESVSSKLQLAKNSINEVALVLGDALLPVLNQLIPMVAAFAQVIAQRFKALPDRMKLIIVAVMAATPVILILMTAIGSLTFAVGIFISGLLTAVSALGMFAVSIAPLALSTAAAMAALLAFSAVLSGRTIGSLKLLEENLSRLATKMRTWGNNIVVSLAAGLIDGIASVSRAARHVAETIAGYFRANSPPEVGPLSQIVQWGKTLIDTYLNAFKLADFSILKDVGSIIRDIFDSFASEGLISDLEVIPKLLAVREDVAKLLSFFSTTGTIAEDIMSRIAGALGEAGDEVAKLLRLSLEYNKTQEDLAALKAKDSGIDTNLSREIARISSRKNLSVTERLEMIRRARARARDAKDAVKDEQAVLEAKSASIKAQLDMQSALIDAQRETAQLLREQRDILSRSTADASAKEKKGPEPLGFSLDFESTAEKTKLAAEDIAKNMAAPFIAVLSVIDKLKSKIDGFFKGLLGEPISENQFMAAVFGRPDADMDMMSGFATGGKVRDAIQGITDKFWALNGAIRDTITSMTDLKGTLGVGSIGGVSSDLSGTLEAVAAILLMWRGPAVWKAIKNVKLFAKALGFLTRIKDIFKIGKALGPLKSLAALGRLFGSLGGLKGVIGGIFSGLKGIGTRFLVFEFILGFVSGLLSDLPRLAKAISNLFKGTGPLASNPLVVALLWVWNIISSIGALAFSLGKLIEKGIMAWLIGDEQSKKELYTAWLDVKKKLSDIFSAIFDPLKDAWKGTLQWLTDHTGVDFTGFFNNIGEIAKRTSTNIQSYFAGLTGETTEQLIGRGPNFQTAEALNFFAQGQKTKKDFEDFWDKLKAWASGKIDFAALIGFDGEKVNKSIEDAINGAYDSIVTALKRLFVRIQAWMNGLSGMSLGELFSLGDQFKSTEAVNAFTSGQNLQASLQGALGEEGPIVKWFNDLFKSIGDKWEEVKKWLGDKLSEAWEFGKNYVKMMVDGIKAMFGYLISYANYMGDVLADSLKRAFASAILKFFSVMPLMVQWQYGSTLAFLESVLSSPVPTAPDQPTVENPFNTSGGNGPGFMAALTSAQRRGIPMSLASFGATAGLSSGGVGDITEVNIYNPVVMDENMLRTMTDQVNRAIGKKTSRRSRLGGAVA